MERATSIIEEIKELKKEGNHRSALRIYTLLENNRKVFAGKVDKTDLDFLIKNFEELTEIPPKNQNTAFYKSEYQRVCEILLFHLNKII